MANFDVATSTTVPSPTGTEEVYILGKKRATLAVLKTYVNTGQVATAQLATEQARISALETATALKASTTDLAALDVRVVSLEGRDLEIGGTVQSANFNAVLGQVTPFTTSASNAVCLPPATGSLTDGAEFAVILFGVPGSSFTCTIDFIARSQTLHGRSENVTITDEITPFRVRWSATHASWFVVS
jgi:hypothetical protein